MKLWLKIAIICTAVLLLIVGICSTLLLLTAKNKILSLAIESAQSEQKDLQESFEQMVTLYGSDDLGPVEKQTLANYCFRHFSHATSALVSGNDTLYSDVSIDPKAILPLAEKNAQKFVQKKAAGVELLVVGSKINVMAQDYSIYTVRDITPVYTSISQLIWQFGAISLACIGLGIMLMIILLRFATKPLHELSRSVRQIAQGEYSQRVQVNTKDEIGELACDFNSMAAAVQAHVEELKEITQRQQLFIGGLTHEFKTPLTSVIGHSETLLYTKMPEEVVERSLLTINEQCKWLERLTQKLLKLITLQEEVQLKDELMEPLLSTVQTSVAETLQMRGISLECRCEIRTLPMDFDLMQSLLINLVDNASKASSPGQTVRIHAHGNVIEVKDEGMGIPTSEISRITEPFYMVDKSRSKKMGGVGLGMALVKSIADAHGAQIAIESVLGRGSTIKLIFHDNKTFTF